MKKIISFALISLFFAFNNSFAQGTNLNIAIIDSEEILSKSLAAKDIDEKISKQGKIYQKQIDDRKNLLEKEYKKIEAKHSTLSEEEFKKENDKISKKINALGEDITAKQKSLKKAYNNAIIEFDKKINAILKDISKEKNLDLILTSSQTPYYQDKLDISAEVLKRVNKEIKTIQIKFE